MPATRVVLDTNAWLDWLVFDNPGIASLRAAVEAGRAEAWIDAPCEAELVRVLAYPLGRFTQDEAARSASLARCREVTRRWEAGSPAAPLPRCRDPDDQKFLVLAAACGAQYLVTRDRALLELRRRAPFAIVVPEALPPV